MQGTIKRVIRDRGFGFIRSTDGQEVFFHRSSLQQLNFDALKEGEPVEFDLERGEKGPRATNVRPGARLLSRPRSLCRKGGCEVRGHDVCGLNCAQPAEGSPCSRQGT